MYLIVLLNKRRIKSILIILILVGSIIDDVMIDVSRFTYVHFDCFYDAVERC